MRVFEILHGALRQSRDGLGVEFLDDVVAVGFHEFPAHAVFAFLHHLVVDATQVKREDCGVNLNFRDAVELEVVLARHSADDEPCDLRAYQSRARTHDDFSSLFLIDRLEAVAVVPQLGDVGGVALESTQEVLAQREYEMKFRALKVERVGGRK